MPVKLDAKMSRKAAVITGNVSDKRGTSHAYVVFQDETAAIAALASNMHMVSPECFMSLRLVSSTGLACLKTHSMNMHSTSVHAVSDNHGVSKFGHSFSGSEQNPYSKQMYSTVILTGA